MVRHWGLTPVAQVNMKQRWNKIDWYILGALLLLALLAWWRVLFLKQWSFGIETDFIRQFYPARVYEVNSLASGTFPLWNPYVLSGQPFFASYQTALLYPPNLMMVGGYALAGAAWTLKAQCFFVVLHLYLAGVFMYLLARDLDAGRAGSAIAAITFMFSGFMVAHAGHLNQVSSAAWMPLVFFLFNRSLTRRSVPYAVWAGVATAGSTTAPSPTPRASSSASGRSRSWSASGAGWPRSSSCPPTSSSACPPAPGSLTRWRRPPACRATRW
jgi:hypothetical protein